MQTPAQCYEASPREMPNKIPPLEYPIVSRCAMNVSITCVSEYVGSEEIDDGVWNVYFGPLKLGRSLEWHMKIEDAYGTLNRRKQNPGGRKPVTYVFTDVPDRSTHSAFQFCF